MTKQTLRTNLTPFRPVTIKMSSGDFFFIPHTDFIMFPPEVVGNAVIIIDSGGGVHLVDTDQIVSLEYQRVQI